jgi:hypothetical protein
MYSENHFTRLWRPVYDPKHSNTIPLAEEWRLVNNSGHNGCVRRGPPPISDPENANMWPLPP